MSDKTWTPEMQEARAELRSIPTPAPSEGPYVLGYTPCVYFVRDTRTGEAASGSMSQTEAADAAQLMNAAHAAALASREVRELVRTATRAHASMIVRLLAEVGSPIESELRAALEALKGTA